MLLQKKVIYMVLGGFLALALTFGAFSAFAQTDEGTGTTPSEPEAGTDSGTVETPAFPQLGQRGFDEMRPDPAQLTGDDELLADALGITVEELQAAQEAVRTAAIEQAVADGLITQDQADQLLANPLGLRGDRNFHGFGQTAEEHTAQLAAELGISVEDLQAALDEVQAARLAEKVEAGILTQEQADMIQAYGDVQGYVDYDGLTETVQSFYQAAIEQALADGVITQDQADLMLENVANMNIHGFPGDRMPGMGGRGGHGGHGGPSGPGGHPHFAPAPTDTTTTDTSGA